MQRGEKDAVTINDIFNELYQRYRGDLSLVTADLNRFWEVKDGNARAHAGYCALPRDHKGECAAVVTRIVAPASNVKSPASTTKTEG